MEDVINVYICKPGHREVERFKSKIDPVSNGKPLHLRNQDAENLNSYLTSEKAIHVETAQTRKKIFELIIKNLQTDCSWMDLVFYPLAIILMNFWFFVPFCFLPANDLVIHPEKWYEILLHGAYLAILYNLFWTYMAGSFLNLSYFHKTRPLLINSLVGTITMALLTVLTHHFWTKVLLYQYPIPFGGQGTLVALNLTYFLTIWFSIPHNLRKNGEIWKRMKFFLCCYIASDLIVAAYQSLAVLIEISKLPYQPFVALIVPITRELTIWIMTKIIKRCTNGDEEGALIVSSYGWNVNHSIIMCYIIGWSTDEITAWVLMGVDFLMNIYLCLRIVWSRKRNPENLQDQTNLLQELAIVEMVEFLAPLSFILVFSLAYYTPVGAIVGNISNDYWAYHAIDDIGETLRKMVVFFLVDFTSTFASATILWFSCNINLWNAFAVLQKEFFKAFNLTLGFLLLAVCNKIQNM